MNSQDTDVNKTFFDFITLSRNLKSIKKTLNGHVSDVSFRYIKALSVGRDRHDIMPDSGALALDEWDWDLDENHIKVSYYVDRYYDYTIDIDVPVEYFLNETSLKKFEQEMNEKFAERNKREIKRNEEKMKRKEENELKLFKKLSEKYGKV